MSSAARKLNLVQKLNKNGDALILESETKKIRQVDILNEDYLETVEIDSTKGEIDLKKLEIGNYIIQARIGRRWIVMYMEKRKHIAEGLKNSNVEISSTLDNITIKNKYKNKNNSSPDQDLKKVHFEENKMYWVVYESNTQFSSRKTMGLKYADEIYDMISQIELEVKSEIGKYNRLLVYEIYNKSKFMRKQLRNRKYYTKVKSKYFNVSPLYNSEVEIGNNIKI